MTTPVLEPAGFFVLRTPLLPFLELERWSQGLRAAHAGEDIVGVTASLVEDRRRLRGRLRELVLRPEVREALFAASPSLEESIALWLEQPDSEHGRKVERSLTRYFLRMALRPTPFGLFAGCSVGRVGEGTRLHLADRASYRRDVRFDGDYLFRIVDTLGQDLQLRPALRFRPSSSLYRSGNRLRYAKVVNQGQGRAHHLVVVEATEAIDAALRAAVGGAPMLEIAGAVQAALADDEVSREDIEAFVSDLVDAQILVVDLEPMVTGADPLADLIAQLNRSPATSAAGRQLADTRASMATLTSEPLGVSPARYREIGQQLEGLPATVDLKFLFQIDMYKPAPQLELGPEPIAEITRAVEVLQRLTARSGDDLLTRFRQQFEARYERREVPLNEALDEDIGIGGLFDVDAASSDTSPLLEELPFAAPSGSDKPRADEHHALLLRKLEEAARSGASEIVLDDADIEQMAGPLAEARKRLPDSLAAFVILSASSDEAFARGEFRVWLRNFAGPSGANLMGRFCNGDELLRGKVMELVRHEEQLRPDVIFAEVAHLPDGRTGNVILRPVLREYEIPYLGRSGAPPERQIPVDDLLVSVRQGRVVLRSRRLEREVVPRFTTALNFLAPGILPMFRFLCALQTQDGEPAHFEWGALDQAAFLPRVRYGRTLFSLARWRLDSSALKTLGEGDEAARFLAVQALRRRYRLPRWVAVDDLENVLPIDLDNVLAVESLLKLVKDRREVVLSEVLTEGLCVSGPEGAFAHEMLVPLLARRPIRTVAATPQPAEPAAPVVRRFAPGSEWLYAKLYGGPGLADQVLRQVVAPVVERAMTTGGADRWFFVRYADPEPHLRLRFHGEPARLMQDVLPVLESAAAAALESGSLWRIQLDTYERELERYGSHEGMAYAEQVFHLDSEAALTILQTLSPDEASDARWRLALRGMDQLLDDFGCSIERKHALVTSWRQRMRPMFGRGEALDHALGAKFRKQRIALEALADRSGDEASPLAPSLSAFATRSRLLQPVVARLRTAIAPASIEDLAGSFLHMHANRMLRGAANAQEFVLLDFLSRIYKGRLARQGRRA